MTDSWLEQYGLYSIPCQSVGTFSAMLCANFESQDPDSYIPCLVMIQEFYSFFIDWSGISDAIYLCRPLNVYIEHLKSKEDLM